MGRPDPARICTSIVERSNLSLRMSIRRFTRLTNAFSKKWETTGSVALWFALLQLLPSASLASRHSCNGRCGYGSHLGHTGTSGLKHFHRGLLT